MNSFIFSNDQQVIGHLMVEELKKRGHRAKVTDIPNPPNRFIRSLTTKIYYWFYGLQDNTLEICASGTGNIKSRKTITLFHGTDLRANKYNIKNRVKSPCLIVSLDLKAFLNEGTEAYLLPRPVRDIFYRKIYYVPSDIIRIGAWNIRNSRFDIKRPDLVDEAVTILFERGYKVDLLDYHSQIKFMPENYSTVNCVVDQFETGTYGLTSIESALCGTPSICYVREENFELDEMKEAILNTKPVAKDIANSIEKCYKEKLYVHESIRDGIRSFYSAKHATNILLEVARKL